MIWKGSVGPKANDLEVEGGLMVFKMSVAGYCGI
jgi:hypothetical protein